MRGSKLESAAKHAAVQFGIVERGGWRIGRVPDEDANADVVGIAAHVNVDHRHRLLDGQLYDVTRATWALRLLAIPDRDQHVRRADERFADQDISGLEIVALSGKGDNLVGLLERLLETVEFVARRKVLAIFVRFEGEQRPDGEAARTRADRGDLVGPARQRGVEKKLRGGVAAERLFARLEPQRRFPEVLGRSCRRSGASCGREAPSALRHGGR
jgi:hypothetical protein